MTSRLAEGAAREREACAALQRAGLTLRDSNVRYRVGELDLVMDDGDTPIARFAQALLDNRGADAVLVDDEDGQVGARHCRHLCRCIEKAQEYKMHISDAKMLASDSRPAGPCR